MTFDDEPTVLQGFTDDAGRLRDEIVKTRAGGGTAVYDAIYYACEKELSHPPRPPGDQPDVVRRVMIVISDGDDNLSTHTRAEAIEMAQRYSVVIYTISTSTQWIQLSQTNPDKLADRKTHLTEGDKILADLAEETGGRAFFPYHVDDLDQSFQDIGDELRNQYSIAYIPTNSMLDGKYHRIRIETPDHKGYQVRARRGYYAKANSTPGHNPSDEAPAAAGAPSPSGNKCPRGPETRAVTAFRRQIEPVAKIDPKATRQSQGIQEDSEESQHSARASQTQESAGPARTKRYCITRSFLLRYFLACAFAGVPQQHCVRVRMRPLNRNLRSIR